MCLYIILINLADSLQMLCSYALNLDVMATDDLLKHTCMLAVEQGDLHDHDWIAICVMHADTMHEFMSVHS